MKLNQAVFYDIEAKRQKYIMASEAMPYVGGVLTLAYFVGFAVRMPLSSKLYKESVYSLCLGMMTACSYPYYYRRHYIQQVEETYWFLRAAIAKHPHMAEPDSDNVNKNFGMSRMNNSGEFDSEEEIDYDKSLRVTGGDAEGTRKEMKSRMKGAA